MSRNTTRRTAAAAFLEVLQLKTWGVIDAKQDTPLGPILISSTA